MPMRIAFVQRQYSAYGGAERVLRDAMSEMVKRGHEVHLLTQQWSIEDEWFKQVKVHSVDVTSKPSFLARIRFAQAASRLVEASDYDIVHSFDRTIRQDFISAGGGCHWNWLKQKSGLTHNPFSHPFLASMKPSERTTLWLERTGYMATSVIVAVSQRVKDEIVEYYGLPPERVEVIYNGVDTEVFNPRNVEAFRNEFRQKHGIHEDEVLILFLGSGFSRKGLVTLIRAAGILKATHWRDQPFRVCVVGKGRSKKYEAMAAQEGIASSVLFAGPIDEPERALAGADIFALPSIYEPFGCVYLEAMATGIPVIATRVAGASEVVQGTDAGAVVDDALSAGELAEKIAPYADAGLRAKAGLAGRAIAEEQSLDRKIEELLNLYTQYVNRGAKHKR